MNFFWRSSTQWSTLGAEFFRYDGVFEQFEMMMNRYPISDEAIRIDHLLNVQSFLPDHLEIFNIWSLFESVRLCDH